MSKRRKKTKFTQVSAELELDIDIQVVIQEIHSRTGTVCDERSQTFSFPLGHDFDKATVWLRSDDAELRFGAVCAEAVIAHDLGKRGSK